MCYGPGTTYAAPPGHTPPTHFLLCPFITHSASSCFLVFSPTRVGVFMHMILLQQLYSKSFNFINLFTICYFFFYSEDNTIKEGKLTIVGNMAASLRSWYPHHR